MGYISFGQDDTGGEALPLDGPMMFVFRSFGQFDTGGAHYPLPGPIMYFNGGAVFAEGYNGIGWLKNVFFMSRDFWDDEMTTPYSGQLFPTGGNSGGPGQVYPF